MPTTPTTTSTNQPKGVYAPPPAPRLNRTAGMLMYGACLRYPRVPGTSKCWETPRVMKIFFFRPPCRRQRVDLDENVPPLVHVG